jgi:hypothetical protein
VAVGTASKRQVKAAFESNQVGEGVMLPVIKHPANVCNSYSRQWAFRRDRRRAEHIQNQQNSRDMYFAAPFTKHKVRKLSQDVHNFGFQQFKQYILYRSG